MPNRVINGRINVQGSAFCCTWRDFPLQYLLPIQHISETRRSRSMWVKPEFQDIRYGFEITMYVYNR